MKRAWSTLAALACLAVAAPARAEIKAGLAAGVELGGTVVSLGSYGTGYGYVYDAVGELTFAGERFGVRFALGYGKSHAYLSGSNEDEWGGISLTASLLFGISRRVSLHFGVGGVYGDQTLSLAGVDHSDGEPGLRLVGGADFILSHNEESGGEWRLRLEARYLQSGTSRFDGVDVTWLGADLVAFVTYSFGE